MTRESQKRANKRYRAAKCTTLSVRLYPADQDIKEHLDGMESKQAYIKALIRRDMGKMG